MSFLEKILNLSNSYQYYKNNYLKLKQEKEIKNKYDKNINSILNKQKELEKQIKYQKKILESQNKLLNIIFIESNLKVQGHLRNVQLQTRELLQFIINICEENDLTYWLDFGTLLGSIRHGGFVPWDDEADIGMPREDYEKFINCFNNIMDKNPDINEKVKLYIGTTRYPEIKVKSTPSPCSQFVQHNPLANVDIHPLDYYDITYENENEFLEYFNKNFNKNKRKLLNKVENGEYNSFDEGARIECKNMKITFEKTEFMGSSVEGAGRKPIATSEIFPLKKGMFEGIECNIPNNPINYLSRFYNGDAMKMPLIVHNHDRTEEVRKVIPISQLETIYTNEISFWENINKK